MATRPEPTINGNCDSWDFIVGKLVQTYSAKSGLKGSLRHRNMLIMHKLSTCWMNNHENNMWVICG